MGLTVAFAQDFRLQVERNGEFALRLSWPADNASRRLEHASSLAPVPAWKDVETAAKSENGRWVVQVQVASSQQYFRLRSVPAILTTRIASASPAPGESGISLNRETVVRWTRPLAIGALLNDKNFYAEAGGRRILSRSVLSIDRKATTLFYGEPLPSSARVAVTIAGDTIRDSDGALVDPDGDGVPGGTTKIFFDTMSLSTVAGTAIRGRVFAAEPVVSAGVTNNQPIEGVIVTVDGAEDRLRALTDRDGWFLLNPCPSGEFFVHIDGREAVGSTWSSGPYYPFVGKTFVGIPGQTNKPTGTGEIFLPLVPAGTLKTVSFSQSTTITMPASAIGTNAAWAQIQVTVPPNALFANDGMRGGKVGIAPVPANRLPSPLPPGLAGPLVVTIQTDGASNFDQPVGVRFPNLPDPATGKVLLPGAKSTLWSYNHDTGRWEAQGAMTVSADGKYLETDPGVGVLQPGWHMPGNSSPGGGPGPGSPPGPCDSERQALLDALASCAMGIGTGVMLDALNLSAGFGCCLGLANAGVATVQACQTPHTSCAEALLYNGFFGAAGCIEGVGTVTGIAQCIWEIGGALGTLTACQLQNQPPNRLVTLQSDRRQGVRLSNPPGDDDSPLGLSMAVTGDLRNLLVAHLGNERWLEASSRDSLNSVVFANACIASLDLASEEGAQVSPGERASLMALPAPDGATQGERTALIDRFDRFAAGGMTAAERSAIDEAAAKLSANVSRLSALGWTKISDGIFITLRDMASKDDAIIGDAAGHERKLKYRLDTQNSGFSQFGDTTATGGLQNVPLIQDTDYVISYLDPETLEIGFAAFRSGPAGSNTRIPRPWLSPPSGPDSDADGLSDLAEKVAGTNPHLADTDGDGASDLTEIRDGLNPLDGLGPAVGVVGNLSLSGAAFALETSGNLAFVGTGNYGVAVLDITDTLRPIRISEIDLPGFCTDLAYAPDSRRLAVVMGSSGTPGDVGQLQFIDLTDPTVPRIAGADPWPVSVVEAREDLIYAGSVQRQEIKIYDAVSSVELARFGVGSSVTGLLPTADYLYVATSAGLAVYDKSWPTPRKIGNLPGPLDPSNSSARVKMILDGTTLFVAKADGGISIDVRNPASPQLLGTPAAGARSWRSAGLNGGGLAMAVSATVPRDSSSIGAILQLFDVRDPSNMRVPLTTFSTLAVPHELAVVGGRVLVADQSSGLTIVNPLPPEIALKVPTVEFDSQTLDKDPVKPGIQLAAGERITLRPRFADDTQFSRMDLALNGTLVSETRVYPPELSFDVPSPCAGCPLSVVDITALDGAGNQARVAQWSFESVADTTPLAVAVSIPGNGGFGFTGQPLLIRFDRRISPTTADPTKMVLRSWGQNGIEGDEDDFVVNLAAAQIVGSTVYLRASQGLAFGPYKLVLERGALTDFSGNPETEPFAVGFVNYTVTPDTSIWISDTPGKFSDGSKWNTGKFPVGGSVLIQRVGGTPEVTLDSGANIKDLTTAGSIVISSFGLSASGVWRASGVVRSTDATIALGVGGIFDNSLSVSGGGLEVSGPLETRGEIALRHGATLSFIGAPASWTATGPVTVASSTIAAIGGAVISLSQFTSIDEPGDFTTPIPTAGGFQADGSGAQMTLPNLATVNGPQNSDSRGEPAFVLEALRLGRLELPRLEETTGRLRFVAEGASTVLHAPMLTRVDGPDSAFPAELRMTDFGSIQAPLLATISNVGITLEPGDLTHAPTLTIASNCWIRGAGILSSNVVMNGKLTIDRADVPLLVKGSLSLTPGTVCEISFGLGLFRDLAGRIDVGGATHLDGAFKPEPVPGFVPQAGQSFLVAKFAKPPSGAFASVDSSALPPALEGVLEQSPTTLTLRIRAR